MGVHDGHRDRLRRKFAEHGLDPFADHEVLELLLFYVIARRDTNFTAHRLLEQFGNLEGVFSASPEGLRQVDGIGEQTALFLHLMGELQRQEESELLLPADPGSGGGHGLCDCA